MRPVYIATAYLGPIQQYCKMLQYPEVRIETAENYVKQTYRNRCVIAAANGPLSLSIPIVKPDTLKCQTKDHPVSPTTETGGTYTGTLWYRPTI